MPAIEVIECDTEADRMYQEIATVIQSWNKRNITKDVSISRLLMVALTMGEHMGIAPDMFHTFVDNFFGAGQLQRPPTKA